MSNKIIYIFFVVLFFIALIFTTTTSQILIDSQNEYNKEIFQSAKTTKNFDKFISIQSSNFLLVKEEETDNYKMIIYNLVNNQNQHLMFIIVPKRSINYATTNKDEEDKTRLLVKNGSKSFIDTNLHEVAISYGLSESEIGFIFFSEKITENLDLDIKYYDYDGNLIFDFLKEFKFYENTEVEITFNKGLTLEEIKEEINYEEKLFKALRTRILIFLALAVFIPFIYKTFKHLLLNKKERQ